jgi:hypothetical protein
MFLAHLSHKHRILFEQIEKLPINCPQARLQDGLSHQSGDETVSRDNLEIATIGAPGDLTAIGIVDRSHCNTRMSFLSSNQRYRCERLNDLRIGDTWLGGREVGARQNHGSGIPERYPFEPFELERRA